MSAIAYFLEAEGIATTGISLVRENTESFAPPRFLWVSFPLGRPLGIPGDAAFQTRVIRAALRLLEADEGPVLADYPEDIPGGDETAEPFVCPVSSGAPAADSDGWAARLESEVQLLAPWYQRALESRGRTTMGITGLSAPELAARLSALLDNDVLVVTPDAKNMLEDLKAFYAESMRAQPGARADTVGRWLWFETELGEAIQELKAQMLASDDAATRVRAQGIVPRWVEHQQA
ncbi:MAG: hypothetical protein CMQ61_12660 [Gammaproteobacteria bacterium]|mgnify:CR=1 FL=1|nr:hypothetical protein [Gammaproteobacteria bacterium]